MSLRLDQLCIPFVRTFCPCTFSYDPTHVRVFVLMSAWTFSPSVAHPRLFLRAQLQTQAVEVRIAAVQRGHHLPQRGSLRSAADGGQVGE